MISTDSIDLVYVYAESHGLVNDELNEFVWCRFPRQEAELLVYRMYPCNNDTRGDLRRIVDLRQSDLYKSLPEGHQQDPTTIAIGCHQQT